MEKDIAALEIRSKTITLVIGNVQDDKVNITNSIIRPLSVALKDGEVLDGSSLTNDIKNMLTIEDKKHNVKINVNEVALVLPPYGLEVYNSQKSTTVISTSSKVDKIDITNDIMMLKKEKIPNQNNSIIDIIPNYFSIDGDKVFTEPPLGETSSQLLVDANIYSLETNQVQDIMDAVENAGVKIRRNVIAPIGASQLFKAYKYTLNTYVLVDSGRKSTSLSFVGNNVVYASSFFSFGFDDLVDAVAGSFNLLHADAEELVNIYGYDGRKSILNPAIVTSTINNKPVSFYLDDLNAIVVKYFQDYLTKFNECLTKLMSEYKDIMNNLNLVFIGENFKINGFKNYLIKFLNNYSCNFPILPNIGIQDTCFVNCAGAILLSSSYRGTLEDDIKGRIKEINREDDKKDDYSETKDEL
jgi:cell division ATPase FtsA